VNDAAAKVEQLISDGIKCCGVGRDWVMLALLMMRRYERSTGWIATRNLGAVLQVVRSFEEKLSALLVDDQVKAKLAIW